MLNKLQLLKIKIMCHQEKFFLNYKSENIKVDIISLPSFFDRKNKLGTPYGEIIMSHTDRMRINPIRGCNFSCQYCDLNKIKYTKYSLDTFKEAIEVALADPNIKPKHLLMSGGVPRPNDYEYLDSIYEGVTKFLKEKNIPADIMLPPRKDMNIISKLYSWGVYGLSINLEIYNEKVAQKINPQKAKLGRDLYMNFIKKSVEIFGNGRVRAALIIGLEPIKETLKGVDMISSLGCDVVLNPFVPAPNTPLANLEPPTEDILTLAYEKSKKIVEKNGVVIGPRCIPCQHNSLAFPENKNDYYYSSLNF